MKRILYLALLVCSPQIYSVELLDIKSNPDYLELVFDKKPELINNSYLGTKNSLILDFNVFTGKVAVEDFEHSLIEKIKLASTQKITRVLVKFNRMLTYRLETAGNTLQVHLASKNIETADLDIDSAKTSISLRETLKNLAERSDINLVVSGKVNGEAIMQITGDTDPLAALEALVEVNNLALKKDGDLWLVTPEKIKETPKPAKPAKPKFVAELIPLRYAKAQDLVKTIKSAKNTLLSEKGSVSADERTNSLLINDTPEKIDEIQFLILELDKPRKQVLIRSKIVIATDDFAKSLGVRFGISHYGESSGVHTGVSGNASGADDAIRDVTPPVGNRFNVNLPAASPTASIGLVIAKLPFGTMLDLELSASQLEGKTKIVASPHVMTADGATAYIQQGVEVPYRTETSDKIDVKFKDALLELRVTPRITPHNHIIMELTVKKDAVGSILCSDCEPSIDTREVNTKVRIKNGETLVIGGIAEDTISNQNDSVPGLSKIPLLGKLFRRKNSNRNKRELFIFITPKIVSG